MSLYPSVWRESGCESHFIVRRGAVLFVSTGHWLGSGTDQLDRALLRAVASALKTTPVHYSEIADSINADPWDVLDACRVLERRGEAREEEAEGSSGTFTRR